MVQKKLIGMIFKIVLGLFIHAFATEAKPKHIVFILADDLGFNDVSWHNPDILSPNLGALAKSGITLENSYVQPLCTPTRAALMTGYYPTHTGRQVRVLGTQSPNGLYTNFTLLPERLNQLGYRSHIVGKWHLGYCNEAYLPTRRGFLSFHGFYNAFEDFYNHTVYTVRPGLEIFQPGYDFRRNEEVDWAATGKYSTFLFAEDAKELIADHALNHQEEPLFLYLALNAPHSPLQVPEVYRNMYPNIQNEDRKTYSGMITAMDEAIGNITQALKDAGMYQDTIIIFSSDNGGDPSDGGNNFPLRGVKTTLYEGGTRAPAFIHAPFLTNGGTVYNGLLHVTDWLPTLYSSAGGNVSDLGDVDGVDQWDSISSSGPSKRREMLYNIRSEVEYELAPGAAYRIGEMKLICGESGTPDGWIEPETVMSNDEFGHSSKLPSKTQTRSLTSSCLSGDLPVQLFNLTSDPNEHFDVSVDHPDLVLEILTRLQQFEDTMIPPNIDDPVEEGNPDNFGGVFSSGWCRAEPGDENSAAPMIGLMGRGWVLVVICAIVWK